MGTLLKGHGRAMVAPVETERNIVAKRVLERGEKSHVYMQATRTANRHR